MKKIITLLVTFLFIGFSKAQAPDLQWQKALGGTDYDDAQAVKPTPDGGYIVAGICQSTDGNVTGHYGGYDFWIVKLSATGSIQWQKSLGGTNNDEPLAIQLTSDGGYIVAGYSSSSDGNVTLNQGYKDFWVIKLNSFGNLQWQKSFGGTGIDEIIAIQNSPDGGYIVAGNSSSNDGNVTGNHGSYDFWVVKLNSSGDLEWQKSLGGTDSDGAEDIQNTPDGGYVVAGFSLSNDGDITNSHGGGDYWVVKLDATGAIQWQKSYGGSGYEYAEAIRTVPGDGYVVVGRSNSNDGDVTGNHGSYDYWVVKLDIDGNMVWQKSLGGSSEDSGYSVQVTSDGGFVLTGGSFSNDGDVTGNHGASDFWIVKLNATGNIQWQQCYGGDGVDRAIAIEITPDGGYVTSGGTGSLTGEVVGNHGNYDYWIAKLSPESLTVADFQQQAIVVYPNPVCEVIQLQTHGIEKITTVKILALDGKIVLEQAPTDNTLNVENLSQGIYILGAYSGDEKYTCKFLKE